MAGRPRLPRCAAHQNAHRTTTSACPECCALRGTKPKDRVPGSTGAQRRRAEVAEILLNCPGRTVISACKALGIGSDERLVLLFLLQEGREMTAAQHRTASKLAARVRRMEDPKQRLRDQIAALKEIIEELTSELNRMDGAKD